MAYTTDTSPHIPAGWYGDTYGDGGIPPANPGETFNCPWTNETIQRITAVNGTTTVQRSVEYAIHDPFNSDKTRIRVNDGSKGAAYVVDLSDYAQVRQLASGAGLTGYWWSLTDPDLIYYVAGIFVKQIKSQVITTGATAVVADLSSYEPTRGGGIISKINVGESNMSLDGKRVAVGAKSDGVHLAVDITTGRVVSELYESDVHADFFDASLGEDGDIWKVAVIGAGGTWREAWDANATGSGDAGVATQRHTWETQKGGGHNDVCVGPDGDSYIIGVESNNTNKIMRWNMTTGVREVLYDTPSGFNNQPDPDASGRTFYFCCNSTNVDGWVYGSTWPGQRDGDPASHWAAYQLEIFRFQYDGSGPIERMFHHRADPHYPLDTTQNYWVMPRFGVSRDGTLLAFNSNFRRQAGGVVAQKYTDVYLHQIGSGPGEAAALSATGSLAATANKTALGSASMGGTATLYPSAYPTSSPPSSAHGSSSMGKKGAI